jgi:hypothetical protein
MYAGTSRGAAAMTDHDDVTLQIVTERFERRLAEERGELRVEIANLAGSLRSEMAGGFGELRTEMSDGFGKLRAEMSNRNAELLKWGLIFGATQTGALAAVVAILR